VARERRRVVAELRALAHPLRLRLFELFAERPRTTMQVATLLGEPPTRLYHHVNALERAGLVRLRETRPNRGTIEKYYASVVEGMKGANAGVLGQGASARRSARAAASAVFEQARQDLLASLAGPRANGAGPMLLRMLFSASPARAASVRKRLLALVKTVQAECAERPNARRRKSRADQERWALTIGLAPSWPRRRGGAE
jgi:DNA-binding transcriptional ArsR family regulator